MFGLRSFWKCVGSLSVLSAFTCLPSAVAGQDMKSGGCSRETLCVGWDAAPRTVDPRYVGTDALSLALEPLLFLPLVGFSQDGKATEVLAESITQSEPTVVDVRLREGIRFAMGRVVSADDVVATYRFLRFGTPRLPSSPRRAFLEKVKSIEKVSERQLRFVMAEPDASFCSRLTAGILPKEALERSPEDIFGLGFESGPFVRESIAGTEWTLKRNEKFTGAPFGGRMPSLARVVFKFSAESSSLLAALEKNEVDLVQNALPAEDVAKFKNSPSLGYEVQTTGTDSTAVLALNLRNKIFQDVRVRRAIALAIDREEILKFTLKGFGTVADSFFPEFSPFFMKNESPIRFHPREAEILLDAAGLKDPDGSSGPRTRAALSIQVPLERERVEVAKAIAAQLQKVGFKVTVEVLEFTDFLKRVNSGKAQMWVAPWTGLRDDEHLRNVFHSKSVPPLGANRTYYANTKLDELLDKAKGEVKTEARKALYTQAQTLILRDFPCVFLWHGVGHAVINKSVSGYRIFPDGGLVSLTQVMKH
ncbi:MAG: hypothetical protein RIR26_36 [Pseudomonadota bacterium]